MKVIKTVAPCALVALGVGATSATAASLITSAQIKDGTIKIRDLSPGCRRRSSWQASPARRAPRARTVREVSTASRGPTVIREPTATTAVTACATTG